MRRLRPTARSELVVTEWGAAASAEQRARAVELLRTLDDGTWDERWWWEPVSSGPEVVEIRIDADVPVFMAIFVDESDGVEYGDIFAIERALPPSERRDADA